MPAKLGQAIRGRDSGCSSPGANAGPLVLRLVGDGPIARVVSELASSLGYSIVQCTGHGPHVDERVMVVCCSNDGSIQHQITQLRAARYRHPVVVVGHSLPCGVCDAALKAGADAWIPSAPTSLLEAQFPRILRALRRRDSGIWSAQKPFDFEPEKLVVRLGGVPIRLRRKEFDLITYLASRPGEWISAQCVLEEVFDVHTCRDTALVRVHIRALRQALKRFAPCVQSYRGLGYRFLPDDSG